MPQTKLKNNIFIWRQYFRLRSLLGLIIIFIVLVSIGEPLIFQLNHLYLNRLTRQVQSNLEQRHQDIADSVKRISNDQSFAYLIEDNDPQALQGYLNDVKQTASISMMMATSQQGYAITRTREVQFRGDNIYLTNSWGKQLSNGESVRLIDKGKLIPLIYLAAEPVNKDQVQVGSVLAGFMPDDQLAQDIQDEVLPEGVELVFYSTQVGLLGSSFPADKQDTVAAIFRPSNQVITAPYDVNQHPISIGRQRYVLNHYSITAPYDPDTRIGGYYVMSPYKPYLLNLLLVTTASFAYVGFTMYVLWKYYPNYKHQFASLVIYGTVITGLIMATWVVAGWKFHIRVTEFKPIINDIYNSTLSILPRSTIIEKSTPQQLELHIEAGEDSINTVNINLTFDHEMVRVDQILTSRSICPPGLFLEKSINNQAGQVVVTCLIPNPGFDEEAGIVAELVYTPLKAGDLSFIYAQGTQIYANDGLGTEVLRHVTNAHYQVTDSNEPQTNWQVFTVSHPNSQIWYPIRQVFTNIKTQQSQPIEYSFHLKDGQPEYQTQIINGIYQISLPAKVSGEYVINTRSNGKSASHIVKVDVDAPRFTRFALSQDRVKKGEVVRVEFQAQDDHSGVQANYYLRSDDNIFMPVQSPLFIPIKSAGITEFTIRAFDNAENYTDKSFTISAEGTLLDRLQFWFN